MICKDCSPLVTSDYLRGLEEGQIVLLPFYDVIQDLEKKFDLVNISWKDNIMNISFTDKEWRHEQKKFTIQEWADHLGITYDEAYEPNVDYVLEDGTVVYKQPRLMVSEKEMKLVNEIVEKRKNGIEVDLDEDEVESLGNGIFLI